MRLLRAFVVVVVGVLFGLVVGRIIDLGRAVDESQASLARSADDVDALRAQLLQLGEKPRVDAPRVGERGEPGEPGKSGGDGRDGRDGRDGVDGITPTCWFTLSQCVGPAGADSTVPGPPGADSTVPGPPGPPGADSTVPGPQGPPGPAGTPCPAGYSWQPDTIQGDDVMVCKRT